MVDRGGGGSHLDLRPPYVIFLHNSPQTFAGTLIHSECFTINLFYIYYVKTSGSETLSLNLKG